MSVLVRFAPAGATDLAQYDETIRRLEEEGDWPPEGLYLHVCFWRRETCASARSGIRGSNSTRSRSA